MSDPGGESYDLAVIGAGPSGICAAIEGAQAGLRVVLIDENAKAGGQVYRAPPLGAATGPDAAVGERLRRELAASAVETRFDHRVWFVEPRFHICAVGPIGSSKIAARFLVIATGAQERHRPIPGWTLPGVIGLAGATNLIKAQRVLPGRRVMVAGAGPLLLLVASLVLKAGAEVAAVVDARSRSDWLGQLSALAGRPDLIARGTGWYAALRRAGVPILHGHLLSRIEGTGGVEGVEAVPSKVSGRNAPFQHFQCDSVCYGFGLMPATEMSRLLRVPHSFDPARGGWYPEVAEDGSSAVRNLYLCGDGAGVLGAAAAEIQGRITGRAVARAAGCGTGPAIPPALIRRLRRAERFGQAMSDLSQPPAEALAAMTPETVVCRCEDLRRRDLESAIAAGATTLNSLKSATRCGMGACGGRVCEDSAAALLAAVAGKSRDEIGPTTARPPLRPVLLGEVAGEFDYFDLPMPEPAPQ